MDLLKAITDLVHVLAWPAVASAGILLFRPELRTLLGRFRRAAGIEFDPPTKQDSTPPPQLTGLPADMLPLPPSATILKDELRAAPVFQGSSDAQRIERLLHTVAYLAFVADAERVEGQIWASQISLLEHLNALDAGDSLSNLKTRFYDPAAAQFPLMFVGYPVESYMGFLHGNGLVEVNPGVARITHRGRDYLAWRIQFKK